MLQLLGMVAGPAGAAWVGVKVAVNGLRADVREIKKDVKDLNGLAAKHGERIATLEAREDYEND